ncbi:MULTISPECIES: hypothetical protein [Mesonia]|uniref:Uncharacterized protein n=1 Tax=Mesonia oceanica TaxID=2687242 RepID=A0AC61Y531_9FLAO|nr:MULTISPECIES: hypothetical protein [Mesonia]MAN27729.1 hypothetical protein [Mesonia sp.]MAQ39668.1 hypothetical protein [Mesonia sp.]VVU99571.1 hypothetical protein FVB9532_00826 [Mesonia oceanica]|tara:strand:- start:34221 stop:34664 length:444 start_codon:yes stop_codon:yes gene_type:complete
MKNLIFLALACVFVSCDSDDDNNEIITDPFDYNCDQEVVVSSDQFENATTSDFVFTDYSFTEGCLELSYSASGCDGSTWTVELIDSGAVMESAPPQRNIRMVLDNQELCQAVIRKETSFDISSLQVEGTDKVILHLENFEEDILYEY